MTLPKELTTVTTVSKTLAFIVVLTLPFIGFYAGVKYQDKMQVAQTQIDLNNAEEINTVDLLSPTIIHSYTPTPTLRPTIAISTDTSQWKQYQIPEVNLSFKLPNELISTQTPKEIIRNYDDTNNVANGSMINYIFCLYLNDNKKCEDYENLILSVGGTSIDFQYPGSGSFISFQGFVLENGKYSAKMNLDRLYPLQEQNVIIKQFTNAPGVDMIKVIPKEDIHFLLYKNEMGAIINTKNSKYPGIQLSAQLKGGITEEIFDTILSTFEFTK